MTSETFLFWMQGFMACSDPRGLSAEQTKTIKDQLSLALNELLMPPSVNFTYTSGSWRTVNSNGGGGGNSITSGGDGSGGLTILQSSLCSPIMTSNNL